MALLGTLTDRDATPSARDALERFLAWKADRHGIDPHGSAVYTNPVNDTQATFPNIAGHRNVAATECPGTAFYATLPTIRDRVAALVAGTSTPSDTTPPSSPAALTATASDRKITLDWADNSEADSRAIASIGAMAMAAGRLRRLPPPPRALTQSPGCETGRATPSASRRTTGPGNKAFRRTRPRPSPGESRPADAG